MKKRVAIVDGLRTPFGKAGGSLSAMGADDLGAIVVKELLARTRVPIDEIDELIFGNVAQPIDAANIARIISLKAGLPQELPAYTVQRNCASGMESITTASNKILAGEAQIIICGGTESMSNIPFIFRKKMVSTFIGMNRAKTLWSKAREALNFRLRDLIPIIGIEKGLSDPVCGLNMGMTAEILAKEFHITREEQDQYAMESHRKAVAANTEGRLDKETITVPIAPNYETLIQHDEGPREDQSLEALSKLRPYFNRDTGTVTVGNACPINDGTAAVLVMSEERAHDLGYEPLGYLKEYSYAGLDGARMGLGPVYATNRLLGKGQFSMKDFDLIELNEAFAAQTIANQRAFASQSFAQSHLERDTALGEIDPNLLNVNGGSIAIGHPVGATGTRIVVTLLKELRRRKKQLGLATLCVGGGQGAALAMEVA